MHTLGYLVIPHCHIEHANAEANQYVIGLPSLTSFTGFAHQQIRLLNQHSQLNLHEDGTAIIVHDFHLRDGHPRCPAYLKEEDASKAASIVEELKADMRVSLIIRIAINDDEEPEEITDAFLDAHFFAKKINNASHYYANQSLQHQFQHQFISGGHCVAVHAVRFIIDDCDLIDWLKKDCRAGSIITDRYDLLAHDAALGITPLESILDCLTASKVDEHRYQRNRKGWLLPVAIGYQAIETPQQRPQSRFGHSHVYAEPITGLAEMVSVKRLANTITDLTQAAIFWTHHYQADNGLYYLTALGA